MAQILNYLPQLLWRTVLVSLKVPNPRGRSSALQRHEPGKLSSSTFGEAEPELRNDNQEIGAGKLR